MPVSRLPVIALITRIGEGAFSRVFLARQPDLASRLVVLKVTPLSTEESDRLAALQHTSIIPIYSVHREADLSCICMPFLGATTLADLSAFGKRWASMSGPAQELVSTIVDRRQSTIRALADNIVKDASSGTVTSEVDAGPDDADAAAGNAGATELAQYSNLGYVDALMEIVIGAVEGLAHAHRRGIIHRDLKPANVLVADDGRPILLDFNLAVSSHEPKTRIVGGTLPYMSPQQLEALQTGAAADRRDDVFSMGVILYELLSGSLPFQCPGSGQAIDLGIVIADRRRPPTSIRSLNAQVSPGLESIIHRCFAPERDQRYGDAGELLEDLNRHRRHLPLVYAHDRSIRERISKWSARHPRISSATSVATFAAAVVLSCLLLIWQRGEQIARLNVQSRFQQLQNDLPPIIAALSTPGREPELLVSGLNQSRQLMTQWHARWPQWSSSADANRLDEFTQQTLRTQLGRLAYLMARAEYHVALQSDDSQASQLREQAGYWNDLAGKLDPKLKPLTEYQRWQMAADLAGVMSNDDRKMSLPGAEDLELKAMGAAASGDAVLWRELTENLLDQQPTSATLWFNLAVANSRLGELDAAVSAFDVANRLQPHSIATLLNRGICHLDRGQPRLAYDDFTACLQLKPTMMVPRFNRALASHRLGDPQAALEDLNHLVNNGQATTRIVLMRSQVHQALGDRDAAEADRQAALRITPRDANDWIARGVSRLTDSPADALADFESALRIRADDFHAISNAAYVCAERLEDPQRAIEWLTRLIAIRPQLASAVASRGILRARLGETEAALDDARVASQSSPQGREQLQIAGIYALVGDRLGRDDDRAKHSPGWPAHCGRTSVLHESRKMIPISTAFGRIPVSGGLSTVRS